MGKNGNIGGKGELRTAGPESRTCGPESRTCGPESRTCGPESRTFGFITDTEDEL
jgi:hypothetical protein